MQFEDHPRPCGEKLGCHGVYPPYGGSPPPMRGKVVRIQLCSAVVRITPAHAGKRLLRLFEWVQS